MPGLLTLGETMGLVGTVGGERLDTAGSMRFSSAGSESTVAIGMSRLGHAAGWIGVVGDDPVGRRVCRDLRAEGVALPGVRVSGSSTGLMVREVLVGAVSRVTYYRHKSAGSTISADDVERGFTGTDADLLHVSGITLALSQSGEQAVRRAVRLACERGMTVSLDVNYRSRLARSHRYADVLADLLPDVDVLFTGHDELWLLTDVEDVLGAARAIADRGPAEVVVRRGTDPALAVTHGSDPAYCPVTPVPVVDVVGAGDGFTAGYLAARAEGLAVGVRLEWGVACAAATVASAGDWEGLPTRADLALRGAGGAPVR